MARIPLLPALVEEPHASLSKRVNVIVEILAAFPTRVLVAPLQVMLPSTTLAALLDFALPSKRVNAIAEVHADTPTVMLATTMVVDVVKAKPFALLSKEANATEVNPADSPTPTANQLATLPQDAPVDHALLSNEVNVNVATLAATLTTPLMPPLFHQEASPQPEVSALLSNVANVIVVTVVAFLTNFQRLVPDFKRQQQIILSMDSNLVIVPW